MNQAANKSDVYQSLVAAADSLSRRVGKLSFGDPVTHVYNPLAYAKKTHHRYLGLATASTEVLFLGMNPGPWGMAQTGVPFGEVAAVRDFLGITDDVDRPENEHPKRPVDGFDCPRSEVSGRRLWGLFADRFGTRKQFFRSHFVVNYCPLVFMESSARNRTPDKLPAEERAPLGQACDRHLIRVIETLGPKYLVGIGVYAEKCLQRVKPFCKHADAMTISRVLHPSPASPAANKDWSGKVTLSLIEAGIWAD